MTETTALDAAHAAMVADDGDEAARLAFHARLAATELFMLLTDEASDDSVTPHEIDLDGGRFVAAFDRESRLSDFAGGVAPYAGLSGGAIAAMLAGHDLGLALNPGGMQAAWLGPDAVAWLARTLANTPTEGTGRPVEIRPPGDLPETLLSALDARLAGARGVARCAWLCAVTWDGGAQGHLLAFQDAYRHAHPALVRLASEALTFSGVEAGALDVIFVDADDAITPRLARVGLRFDLPLDAARSAPGAPGMDPARPPRLT